MARDVPSVCALSARWLGRVGYAPTAEAQRTFREAVIAGREPGEIWMLEHPPVITAGRRPVDLDYAQIAAAGFEVAVCERGGRR